MYMPVQPPTPSTTSAPRGTAGVLSLVLESVGQGIFALDAADRLVEPLSASLASLFRRSQFAGLAFSELLQPIVPRKFLSAACQHLVALRAAPQDPALIRANPLLDLEVRFANGNGTNDLYHYSFEFAPMNIAGDPGTLLVRVTDRTTALLQAREIEDLRQQLRIQSDILQTILRLGTSRFATVILAIDAAMNAINDILRRPAREQSAFRDKLEQTLAEVDRISRNVAATQLIALAGAARHFEKALLELRDRPVLSGNDFLPLAVKLDELFVQFALVQSLSRAVETRRIAEPAAESDTAGRPAVMGQERTAAPKFVAQLLEHNAPMSVSDSASAGTLAHTLARLTEHAAEEFDRPVALRCQGLEAIPADYQSTVKNIAVQLIRNAIMHGIESRDTRVALGKPPIGQLMLDFITLPDGSYELTFEDDGRGIDPETVREVAISKSLLTPGAAVSLGDRQVLKYIFKSRFTTLDNASGDKRHGAGLAFVRRYVHGVGGIISIGSEPGRATRFKVSLPAPGATGVGAAVDNGDSDESHVA
jgi:two-component system, chemotaxis family, sensor kinase CheA